MDIYHIWCDLAEGASDIEFADAVANFLEALKAEGRLAGWRLMRRKLGLGDAALGEFHLMLEFEDLAQLDRAFGAAASRTDPMESLHFAVNSRVKGVRFSLYRDFPDAARQRGEEKF